MKNGEFIYINKMYTGSYTENNIGHEIINFFKADNNKNYIYIVPHGCIGKDYKKIEKVGNEEVLTTNIKYILFTSPIFDDNKLQILGKAEGLELLNKYKDSDKGREEAHNEQENWEHKKYIKYGKKEISKIFEKNEKPEKNVYVTFKADKVFKVKEPIIITMGESENQEISDYKEENAKIIKCNWTIGRYQICLDLENEDGKLLKEIIENPENWDDKDIVPIDGEIINKYSNTNQFNFLKLILKEDDETIFTNMFYYYLKNNDKMLKKFIEHLNEKSHLTIDLNRKMKIEREKPTRDPNATAGEINKLIDECKILKAKEKYDLKSKKTKYIDLWIESDKDIIIIENKINSGLNGIDKENNLSQLDTYYQYAKLHKGNRNINAFIFVPNYNEEKIKREIKKIDESNSESYGKEYKIITYKDLYDFFGNEDNKDKYYNDFLNAISKHIYEPSEEMERRFVFAIQNAK